MAVETENENLAEYEQAYEALFANEELDPIGEKLDQPTTGTGKSEVWHVYS